MHAGKTDKELCELYDRDYNNNKAQWSDLAYKMLGIKGNHAEEFIKANIVVKSIRLEQNGIMKESISLPPLHSNNSLLKNLKNLVSVSILKKQNSCL